MIELVVLVVLGLASYRLTRIFVIDTIFEGFRAKFHVKLANRDGKSAFLAHKLLELLSCTWCFGVWMSLFLYAVYVGDWPWAFGRLDWINVAAVAGLQGLLHSWEPEE